MEHNCKNNFLYLVDSKICGILYAEVFQIVFFKIKILAIF